MNRQLITAGMLTTIRGDDRRKENREGREESGNSLDASSDSPS